MPASGSKLSKLVKQKAPDIIRSAYVGAMGTHDAIDLALDYRARVSAAGGLLTDDETAHCVNYFNDLLKNQLLSKVLDAGVFLGGTLASSLVKIIERPGSGVVTGVNMVAGDFTSLGAKGNGTNKSMNINYPANTLGLLYHQCYYDNFTIAEGVSQVILGNSQAGANDIGMQIMGHLQSGARDEVRSLSNSQFANVTQAHALGFHLANRLSDTVCRYNVNGSLIASVTTGAAMVAPGSGRTNGLLATHTGAATYALFSTARMAYYSMGSAFTIAEEALYQNTLQNFMHKLGRAI